MSIYGGFASRSHEGSYNRSVYNLLCLLQMKVVHSLRGKPFDDALLGKYFQKFYGRVVQLDECKYLPPKFSCALKDLANYYGIPERPIGTRPPSVSSTTSSLSFQQFQVNNSLSPALDNQEEGLAKLSRSSAKFKFNQTENEQKSATSMKRESRTMRLKSSFCSTPQNRAPNKIIQRNKQQMCRREDSASRSTINNNIIITINRSFDTDKKNRTALPPQKASKQFAKLEHIYTSVGPKKGKRGIRESPTFKTSYDPRNQRSTDIDLSLNGGYNYTDLEVIRENTVDTRDNNPRRKGKIAIEYRKFVPILKR